MSLSRLAGPAALAFLLAAASAHAGDKTPAGTVMVQYLALLAAPEMPVTATLLDSAPPPELAPPPLTVTEALLLWVAPLLSVTVRVTV